MHTRHSQHLAGQLIMVRLAGTELDAASAAFLQANRVRGVCLFRQNMRDAAQLRRLNADLRAAMGAGALIALDQEGGAVMRPTWVPAAPSAMALGAADDPALAYAVGAAVARAVRSLGFNWNFAPVLDLNSNPHNPVIAERSFGADAPRAGALAMAWMAGSAAHGVACCVKHFPGHGDTSVDSHRDLPTVDKPLAALAQCELAPFRLAAGHAPAMMTAHIMYPALDDAFPATLSRRILTGLLREQWQYDGVIITDAMDMHAIASRYGAGHAAVMALAAGADMVMALGSAEEQQQSVDAIAAAIDDGTLAMADVEAKLARLAALAQAHPCQPGSYEDKGKGKGKDEDEDDDDDDGADRLLMASAWQRALTAYGPLAQLVRPAPGAKVRLVVRQDGVSDGVSEVGVPAAALAASLARLYDVDTVTFADPEAFDWDALPADGRFTMLASTSRLRYGARARASWRPHLHLALWNPYQALDIAAPALITYGFAAPALDAVNGWLAGRLAAPGRCPVAGF